jgi:hypothetical protein
MKGFSRCLACLERQTIEAAHQSTQDETLVQQILSTVRAMLKTLPPASKPPLATSIIYETIEEFTGNPDPYQQKKKQSTEEALLLYPWLKGLVASAPDPLFKAAQLAISGNIIDLGLHHPSPTQIRASVEEVLTMEFAICDYDLFRQTIEAAPSILYLGDNAGETVFDRVLIEQINKPTTFVVRAQAVINDAIYADALDAGIETVATIISSGSRAAGIIPQFVSEGLKHTLQTATCIISKGQGNFEGLEDEDVPPTFFLLRAKCPVIADYLHVEQGALILKANI